jgi:hypothetical protein
VGRPADAGPGGRPHRPRYLGYLLGIDEPLLPVNREDQEKLEELYLLTRPAVDPYCRSLVAST